MFSIGDLVRLNKPRPGFSIIDKEIYRIEYILDSGVDWWKQGTNDVNEIVYKIVSKDMNDWTVADNLELVFSV